MKRKIQRVELNQFYDTSIFCPFCGKKVVDMDAGEAGEEATHPCVHTLFVSHDEGFEYRSTRFDQAMTIEGAGDEAVMGSDTFENMDAFTDRVEVEDGIKFASYVGPPSGFGSYVGFAPVEA